MRLAGRLLLLPLDAVTIAFGHVSEGSAKPDVQPNAEPSGRLSSRVLRMTLIFAFLSEGATYST
jgi:hypothetical protein